MDYISQFFVHAKNKQSDNHEASDKYHIVVNVMITTAFFPLSLLLTFTALDYFYIYPKLCKFLKQLYNTPNKGEKQVQYNTFEDKAPDKKSKEQLEENTSLFIELLTYNSELKMAYTPALLILNVALHAILFIIYSISMVKLFEYSDELFYQCSGNNNCKTSDYVIPIIEAVISCVALLFIVLARALTYYKMKKDEKKPSLEQLGETTRLKNDDKPQVTTKDRLVWLTASSLGINIMIVGIFFAPYILLAVITDPLQAIFFYSIVIIFLGISYFFILALLALYYYKFWKSLLVVVATASITYFLVIFNLVLTLGSINNFQDAQSLILTLLIGLFTLFVLKPFYKQLKEKLKGTSTTSEKREDTPKDKKDAHEERKDAA